MKAMIFAAGLGTRLRPLTDTCPKALVPVAGKPMLEHIIYKLKAAGFTDIIVNIHHFGQQVIDFLEKNRNFGLHIEISDERDFLLDTGGGIKKAAPFFKGDEPFVVHNVDILSDIDLDELYSVHCKSGALATLSVGKRNTARYFLFDSEHKLCGWQNKKSGEVKSCYADFVTEHYQAYAFNGIHILSPEIFNLMEGWDGKFSITDFYLATADKAKILACPEAEMQWLDMGKPETILEAERWLEAKEKEVSDDKI